MFISIISTYYKPLVARLGKRGNNATIIPPAIINGYNNIFLDENVSIGANSVLFAPNSTIVIKKYTIIGPNVLISTGNHYSKVGKFISETTEKDKLEDGVKLNRNVVIEEDVWIGANVSVLCKKIGRGAIVACGAVVKSDVLPYSIVGGVPAKIIKMRFSLDEIYEHERLLYEEKDRIDLTFLMNIFKKIQS